MRPVVTVAEMGQIDAEARATVGLDALVSRAGAALARVVLGRLGGVYARRVVVVAGPGHNGDDGRVAAGRLARRGVAVTVVPAGGEGRPPALPPADLVVDAAYGTGFRGSYQAPVAPPGAEVVAVDIPSGVGGDTGEAGDGAVRAQATVTFAALKPGLLWGAGLERAGQVIVADIGLDASRARAHLVEDADVVELVPSRPREAHKWQSALYVLAGSPGMMGSASLCSRAAMRAGSGMVRLGVPGAAPSDLPADEVVARVLPVQDWQGEVLEDLGRCRALVLGPGLGRSAAVAAGVRFLVARSPIPVLVDADGLNVLGSAEEVAGLVAERGRAGHLAPVVLTPHAGEYGRLAGSPPGADRLAAARDLARRSRATVLLKGSTTIVADPEGRSLITVSGSSRLATAGTGDVLSGVIGAFLARGAGGLAAAGLGAHAHGRAAGLGLRRGLVAGDLGALIGRWLSGLGPGAGVG